MDYLLASRRALSCLLFAAFVSGCGGNSTPIDCTPACSAGFSCVSGSCVFDGTGGDGGSGDMSTAACNPACSAGTHCNASGYCVACVDDTQCPDGTICKTLSPQLASCVQGCADSTRCGGKMCCDKQCTDTTTSPYHCGGCDMPCSANHAQPTCTAGKCGTGMCDNGWGDCNGDPKDGCEANLHVDSANCTACGMGCALDNAIAACSDGCYIAACTFGWDDCNNNTDDGCETSVLTDLNNCGGCGVPCNGLPNAKASCTAGNCVLGTCNQGFYDCNGKPNDGCESNIAGDANNCGACGNVCANGLVCKNGGCTCAMCNFPNAASSCVNNVCVLGQCIPNFANCDGNANNGCEAGLNFDKNNCGKCGNVCPNQTPYCVNGACSNVGSRILLLAADSYSKDVQMVLTALNFFTSVDVMDGTQNTPTLAQLQQYDAVMAWSNSGFKDPAGTGNVLATYFDQGGRVVIAVFANASIAITGNWTARQLIMPSGQEEPNDSLGVVNEPNSPLMSGVTKLAATSAFRSTGGAINGGVVVAAWASGKPLIVRGVLNNRNYVSLNMFPPSASQTTGRNDFWTGDGAAIMRNALMFQ